MPSGPHVKRGLLVMLEVAGELYREYFPTVHFWADSRKVGMFVSRSRLRGQTSSCLYDRGDHPVSLCFSKRGQSTDPSVKVSKMLVRILISQVSCCLDPL